MDILCKDVSRYVIEEKTLDAITNVDVRCRKAYAVKTNDDIIDMAVEKVIFNGPATIVFFRDGTKSVVKCQDMSMYDQDKGLAFALLKKLYGNGYNDIFKKFLWECEEKEEYNG